MVALGVMTFVVPLIEFNFFWNHWFYVVVFWIVIAVVASAGWFFLNYQEKRTEPGPMPEQYTE